MIAQRKGIQSVEQGVRLLETLIASRKPLPLRTLAQMSGMSPSMAHRYLTSFIRSDNQRYTDLSLMPETGEINWPGRSKDDRDRQDRGALVTRQSLG